MKLFVKCASCLVYICCTYLLISKSVLADDWKYKIYLTDQLGNAQSEVDKFGISKAIETYPITDGSISFKDSARSFHFGLGFDINDNVAIEVLKTDLGNRWINFEWERYTEEPQNTYQVMDKLRPQTATGWEINTKYHYYLSNQLDVYGTVGLLKWRDTFTSIQPDAFEQKQSGTDVKVGAGLRYKIDNNFYIRAGIDEYVLSKSNVTNMYFGIDIYPFNKRIKTPIKKPIVLDRSERLVQKNDAQQFVKQLVNNPKNPSLPSITENFERNEPKALNVIESSLSKIVYFAFDDYTLDAEALTTIKEFYRNFKQLNHANFYIHIIGHADEKGTEQYNYELSKTRAKQVKSVLIQSNILPEKILIEAKGEKAPQIRTAKQIANPQNRRAEIKLFIK